MDEAKELIDSLQDEVVLTPVRLARASDRRHIGRGEDRE
jgi:hypothetical protein